MDIEVSWTGRWPNLCDGRWILIINGEDKSYLIPESKIDDCMNTYGNYQKWHFSSDWDDVWETYSDGMNCDEWIEANKDWIYKISEDEKDQQDLFYAFQSQDWRHGSCGGCI